MNLFEALAMVCFGASWPFAIARTVRTRSSKGKSLVFLGLLLTGYFFGVVNKLVYAPGDWVVLLWIANGVMVATDLTLSLYFRKNDG